MTDIVKFYIAVFLIIDIVVVIFSIYHEIVLEDLRRENKRLKGMIYANREFTDIDISRLERQIGKRKKDIKSIRKECNRCGEHNEDYDKSERCVSCAD